MIVLAGGSPADVTRARKIWDFGFAAMLIGGLPVVVLYFTALVFGYAFPRYDVVGSWMAMLASVASFWFVCRWRRKRRLIASSFFPAEVAVGALFGTVYFITLVAAGYAAYRAD